MPISAPERIWWKPAGKEEKIWIAVALTWCILITLIMPYWHITGKQNPPQEYYRVSPTKFASIVERFTQKYKTGEENGVAIVEPPEGDIFIAGSQFVWHPILKLQSGKTYRLHLSSTDVQHGFSIYPLNMNFMALPDMDYVLTIQPDKPGEYFIICNEFCGGGHHAMTGKIIVM